MALKLNKNSIALKTLMNRPHHFTYEPFHLMSYYLGVSKLYKTDSSAVLELKSFIHNYKGESYLKSAYEKLSWFYVINGDENQASYYKKKIAYVGKAINNEDKQASRYTQKVNPHRIILKSRLLYDGGYYNEAYDLLNSFKVRQLTSSNEKAEFCYRKGRVLQKLGLIDRALIMYEACSLYAIQSKEYYGAYACLYLGDYYSKEGSSDLAIKFYTRSMSYSKNQEYVDSIHSRAKAGLKKLE
jgi:tetratricopeptide (TPR) repeat protein